MKKEHIRGMAALIVLGFAALLGSIGQLKGISIKEGNAYGEAGSDFFVFCEEGGTMLGDANKVAIKAYMDDGTTSWSTIASASGSYYRITVPNSHAWDYFELYRYPNNIKSTQRETGYLSKTEHIDFTSNSLAVTSIADTTLSYRLFDCAENIFYFDDGGTEYDTSIACVVGKTSAGTLYTSHKITKYGPVMGKFYQKVYVPNYFDIFYFKLGDKQTPNLSSEYRAENRYLLQTAFDYSSGQWVSFPTTLIINYLDVGGGPFSGTMPPGEWGTMTIGTTFTLPRPTKKGHSFINWITNKAGTGTIVTQITFNKILDQTIYAKWEFVGWTLSYEAGSGISGTMDDEVHQDGETITLARCQYEKQNCGFVGWGLTAQTDVATYKDCDTLTINDDITLYPIFSPVITKKVTVEFIVDPDSDWLNPLYSPYLVSSGDNKLALNRVDGKLVAISDSGAIFKSNDLLPCFSLSLENALTEETILSASCSNTMPSDCFETSYKYAFTMSSTDESFEPSFAKAETDIAFVSSGSLFKTISTRRVWISAPSNWSSFRMAVKCEVYNGTTGLNEIQAVICSSVQNALDEKTYYYADINVNCISFTICKIDYSNNVILSESEQTYSEDTPLIDAHSSLIFGLTEKNDGYVLEVNAYSLEASSISGILASKVIEGYQTCLESETNGYLAVDELTTNWIAKLSGEEKSAFDIAKIRDYDDNGTVSDDAVFAKDKYEMMLNMFYSDEQQTLSFSSSSFKNGNLAILAGVISSFVLSSLTVVIINIKRKKENID